MLHVSCGLDSGPSWILGIECHISIQSNFLNFFKKIPFRKNDIWVLY
jgi:hypothetical protein